MNSQFYFEFYKNSMGINKMGIGDPQGFLGYGFGQVNENDYDKFGKWQKDGKGTVYDVYELSELSDTYIAGTWQRKQ